MSSLLMTKADADKIDALREYAGTAMPTFLFYQVWDDSIGGLT